MQRMQRSFYKERKRTQECGVLLKRTQERGVLLKRTQRNTRSFENNACPTLHFSDIFTEVSWTYFFFNSFAIYQLPLVCLRMFVNSVQYCYL